MPGQPHVQPTYYVNKMSKKRKNKNKITKEDLMNIEISAQRKVQAEQGFFDGRFKTKSLPNKKKVENKKLARKKVNLKDEE